MAKTNPNGHMPLALLEKRLNRTMKIYQQRASISQSSKYVAERDKGRVPFPVLEKHLAELIRTVGNRQANRSAWK